MKFAINALIKAAVKKKIKNKIVFKSKKDGLATRLIGSKAVFIAF